MRVPIIAALLATIGAKNLPSIEPKEQAPKQPRVRPNPRKGSKVQAHDGTIYEVTASGAWRRLSSRRCDASENTRNHGVRRRLAKKGISL